jgi:hypothetical protein
MTLMKWLAVAVLVAGVGGVAIAAEEVKVDLKTFKWKCAFEGGADLGGYDENDERFFFYTNGTATGDVTIPEDGEYTVTVDASCTEALKEFAKFKVTIGEVVVTKEHACTVQDQKKYPFTAKLKKGKQPLVVGFINDVYKDGEYDRNLFVYSVKVEKK